MNAAERNRLMRSGSARWTGSLAQGEGRLSTGSGVLQDQRYSFATRFQHEQGTNPEELIAVAHAGCFCMALAYSLGQAGKPPQSIEATAELSLQMGAQGPSVIGILLVVRASVAGIAPADFEAFAQQAKTSCLVSRLLNTEVRVTTTLLD